MKQLKMCYLRKEPEVCPLPKGYSAVKYSEEKERLICVELCKNGLARAEAGVEWFEKNIENYHDCKPFEDVFFIKYGEEYVATITAIFHPKRKEGYVHMVSVSSKYRGRGLAKPLNALALKKLYDQGAEYITLTTDDSRVPAVKSYLKAGFLPMLNGFFDKKDAVSRWKKIYSELGLENLIILSRRRKPIKL